MSATKIAMCGDVKITWPAFTMDMAKGITEEELNALTSRLKLNRPLPRKATK